MVPSKQQRTRKQTNNEFIMYQQPPIDYMRSLPSLSTVVPKAQSDMIQPQMINQESSFSPANNDNTTSAVTPIPTQRTYVYNGNNNGNTSGGINTVLSPEEQQNLYNNQQHMIHNSNEIVDSTSLPQHQQQAMAKNSNGHQNINTPASIAMDNNSLRFYQRMEVFPQSSSSHTFYSSQPLQTTNAPSNNSINGQETQQPHPTHNAEDQSKVYSFMPLESVFQQKRPRRKFNEIERLYKCNYFNCTKAYGTLNHLNAHISMQEHGPKRLPVEFKELRKQLRKSKAEITARNRNSISSSTEGDRKIDDYPQPIADMNTKNNEFTMRNVETMQNNDVIHGNYSGTTTFSGNPIINHPDYQYRNYQPQPQPTTTHPQQAYQRQLHLMQQQQQQQFH